MMTTDVQDFKAGKMLRNACFGIEAHSGPGYKVWLQGEIEPSISDHGAGPKAGSPSLTRCPLCKVHVDNASLSSVALTGAEATLPSPSAGGKAAAQQRKSCLGKFPQGAVFAV